jgi:3-phosphoshikimate 1-carboxyvinyltransferase
LKESDRIESVCATLSALGADIESTEDGMIIHGCERLVGGEVDSYNDHRIAMSAAVASLDCKNEVKINRFEAINKSYPSFTDVWEIKD